ncbi:MAG: family 78 glycoside hydrolase catalytic domain [Clostridia bacterium]|nr:family 78 glycoside hydrolase catalytic domain [Clostridia bacterium]
MLNSNWIGIRKGEINSWPEEGYTTAMAEELKGKVRVERRSLLFRKQFVLNNNISSATLSVCGLGFYFAFVNGKAADSRMVLAPLYNDYTKRVFYDDYDVSDLLKNGKNVIGIEVGGGWFCPPEKWWSWRSAWYGNPRMIAELTVNYTDGTKETVVSNDDWKYTYGGVIESCIYDGEKFDAREVPDGWNTYDFDDSSWQTAEVVEAPKGKLQKRPAPPVRIRRILKPVNVLRIDELHYIYDFGENNSALPCITVRGKEGDSVTLNHSEFAKEDGTLDTRSNNLALCEDCYTLSGKGDESYRPHFTWHCFRYLMVTLSSPDIEIISAESHVLHSDVSSTGSFSCSRDDLNRVHDVITRTALACLIAVPLDCPQRDERLPWLGDVHASSEVFLYNYDMESLYDSFLEDLRLSCNSRGTIQIITPRPYVEDTSIDWNVAYPALLLEYYRRYGNKELLAKHFETLRMHTNHYVSVSKDGLIENCWFGDWFSVDQIPGVERSAGFRTSEEGDNQNPPYNGSLFYYLTLKLSAEIASYIGKNDDAAYWEELAENTRQSIIKTYYDADSGIFGRGGQFSQTFPLALNVLQGTDREKAFAQLLKAFDEHDGHSVMGVMGVRRIFDLFINEGHPELAYELLTKEGYPGVLDHTSHGRTTLPEGLAGNGSGCHIMFGHPDAVLYSFLAGIRIDRTKDAVITINPYVPDDLTYVNCEQILPEGKVVANWKKQDNIVKYHIEIPTGLKAVFCMSGEKDFRVLDGGTYDFCKNI